ncbi:hypothetical protein OTU49_011231, partial [Cherax quadricarinatus]
FLLKSVLVLLSTVLYLCCSLLCCACAAQYCAVPVLLSTVLCLCCSLLCCACAAHYCAVPVLLTTVLCLCCSVLCCACAAQYCAVPVLLSTVLCLCCSVLCYTCAAQHRAVPVLLTTVLCLCCSVLCCACAAHYCAVPVLLSTVPYLCCSVLPRPSLHLKMMSAATYAMMAAVMVLVAGELAPPEKQYKIMMLLPVSSQSHKNVFIPLARALADRGHQVTILANSSGTFEHPNITEITHGIPQVEQANMFEYRNDWISSWSIFAEILPTFASNFYKVPKVKKLYERRKEFDLFMVDHGFNEVVYPFLHEAPFIMVTTPGIDYRQSAVLGNVFNPVYVNNHMSDFPRPFSLWHRFYNALYQILFALYWRNWTVVPQIQKEISAQFPELPPLLELERNMSLALMNTHFSIGIPLPLLPSQVEVGAMHCRPGNPLPQELESWITGAGSAGVIYFNMGTVVPAITMPVQYRDLFIEAFRRLPQRVIWKYEGELEDVPDNLMITNWLPQQDILAHDNVKVFITHCGLLSMQEAIYHATPLLAVPIFADQPRNSMFIRNSEMGEILLWEELTEDMIVDAITNIISNPKYKENIVKKSKLMRDQPVPPTELAVFWTEYVIRHKGAPQLRSPAAQLSWVEFLMLDVIFLLHLTVFFLYFITRRILRVIYAKIFSSKDIKKKKE